MLTGAAPTDGEGPLAARGRLGPRPPLVPRPDGAHQPAAGRADDADLARLVRDIDGRRRAALHARPERALPPPRARARSASWPLDVTADPAMIQWLSQTENTRYNPNENYARELMELFTLGADRGAYTEDDVRELARSLTGWRSDWTAELGEHNFRFDATRHDPGQKTVFGRTGAWSWQDAVRLCLENPKHASFVVREAVELLHPRAAVGVRALGPRGGVHAGRLRDPAARRGDPDAPAAHRRPADGEAAGGLSRRDAAPSAPADRHRRRGAGWPTAWASACSARPTWPAGTTRNGSTPAPGAPAGRRRTTPSRPYTLTDAEWDAYDPTETPQAALNSALAFWGNPQLTPEGRAALLSFATTCLPTPMANWQQGPYRAMRQNALRQLLAMSPDLQTS